LVCHEPRLCLSFTKPLYLIANLSLCNICACLLALRTTLTVTAARRGCANAAAATRVRVRRRAGSLFLLPLHCRAFPTPGGGRRLTPFSASVCHAPICYPMPVSHHACCRKNTTPSTIACIAMRRRDLSWHRRRLLTSSPPSNVPLDDGKKTWRRNAWHIFCVTRYCDASRGPHKRAAFKRHRDASPGGDPRIRAGKGVAG